MLNSEYGLTDIGSDGRCTQFLKATFKQLISPYFKFIIPALFMCLYWQTAHAAEVSLAWEASNGAMGYKVYYGLESQNYPFIADIGLSTQCTISALDFGETYYFTVTAYNEYGESDFAREISYSPDLCVMDLDSDGDIDGWELAEMIADPSIADISIIAFVFGRPNCDN
jgi:hypothetical protein